MALKHRRKALLGIILTILALASPGYAQSKAPDLFTVGNVFVKAEAETATEAKNIAQQKAIEKAFRHLLYRLSDFRVQNRIPPVTIQQAGASVVNLDVRNEGITSTSYQATFSVRFSDNGVRQFLSQYGISTIEERGPEITILPIYIEAGAARTTDRNPWRNALVQLDLSHAHVPGKLMPTRSNITAALAKAYIASPTASLQNFKTEYHTGQLVMAVAEVETGGEAINVTVIGNDSMGEFNVKRKIKTREEVDDSLMDTAARLAFEAIQERWKLTRFSAGVAAGGNSAGSDQTTATTGGADNGGGYTGANGGGSSTIQITAVYSGLAEWRNIRARLQALPGIQNWDLREVTARSATVSFDYPGGAERWRQIASEGLEIEAGANGYYIVKTK